MRKEYIILAIESIRNNKLRAWLSMLWIIIWVSSVIIMLAIWEWSTASIVERFEDMWANNIVINAWWSNRYDIRRVSTMVESDLFDNETVWFLQNIDWIEKVSPQVSSSKQMIYKTNNTRVSIIWVLPNYLDFKKLKITNWRFIWEEDHSNMKMVIVLGKDIATTLFGEEDPIWKDIKTETSYFTVIGVLWDNSKFNNLAIVPLSTAQFKILWNHYYWSIEVSVKDNSKIDSIMTNIEDELMLYYWITDKDNIPFSVNSFAEILSSIKEVTGTMTIFLAWIAAISLIVWGIWVMNIMLVSVIERTREIGIRKAIWACKRDILRQFLIESVFLSLFAWFLWIFLSLWIVSLLNRFFPVIVKLDSVIIAFASAVSIGIIFWILPASKASKLKPVDALRYE